jgi:hypothetical protein
MTAENVARGSHTVRLFRAGYRPFEQRVTVTGDQPSTSVSAQLTPEQPAPRAPATAARSGSTRPTPERGAARAAAVPPLPSLSKTTGSLFISSRPAGASVLIDGKPSGTTPMLMEGLSGGDHVIHLDATGYRRWTSAVQIVPGERSRVAASLER